MALIVSSLVVGCGSGVERTPRGAVVFPPGWPFAADAPAVTAAHGMVSSADPYATEVGLKILQAGGNAVDAAIAVGFALAVVDPQAGNIGGGGFMVVRTAEGEAAALDYREKAPLAASRDMFLDVDGNPTDRSRIGHLAIGVPGSVRGLWEAHRRFGSLPWADLVAPAIRLADGIVLHEELFRYLHAVHVAALGGQPYFRSYEEELRRFESTEAQFLAFPAGGQLPFTLGGTFRQPGLASTLRRIAQSGPDGFYKGETAHLIVAEMKRGGGLITHEDLESYTAEWRTPVTFSYRGHTVISMPPVSSGGVTMALIANILEGYDLRGLGWHSPEHVHLLIEAMKRAFADRNRYLGDPDFVDIPLERLISKEYAEGLRASINLRRATPAEEVAPGLEPVHEGEHTTHYSIVDGQGNAASVTTTIAGAWRMSPVSVRGAGFILNNEMVDFTAKPGSPNFYGLVQGEANAVEGGKRMLSSMAPSIVLDPTGKLLLVTGTGGGPRIITMVFQNISNVVDFGMNVVQAVHAPRVHHQHLPDEVQYGEGGLPPETIRRLEALGHKLQVNPPWGGGIQAIMVLPDGTLAGVSDPREPVSDPRWRGIGVVAGY